MSLDDVVHPRFTYLLIPQDINSAVEELEFEGKEADFREHLKSHLNREKINSLNQKNFQQFKEGLKEKADGKIDEEGIERMVQGSSHNYQIIPLTLPTKANAFKGINAYIDSVGRIKDLPTNARATRVCSTDIRGDCFLSRVFDDEEVFQRVDIKKNDLEKLMENPPDAKGRWSETQAAMQLLQQTQASAQPQTPAKPKCENCGKEETLKRCARCCKSFYCSEKCQREDWSLHKRICVPIGQKTKN